MSFLKIAWLDSVSMPSHIHVIKEGEGEATTRCGHDPAQRNLAKVPGCRRGQKRRCRRCFDGLKAATLSWHPACGDTEPAPDRSRPGSDDLFVRRLVSKESNDDAAGRPPPRRA